MYNACKCELEIIGAQISQRKNLSAEKGDEDEVALALEDVWPLWYEIGAGLEIPTSTLDQIQGAPEDQTIVRIFSVYVYTSSSVHIGARLGKLTVK